MTKILAYFIASFFVILISIPSLAQWVSKANALRTRSEVTSIVYNGKLYAFLGFLDAAHIADPTAEVYDPVSNTWKMLDSLL